MDVQVDWKRLKDLVAAIRQQQDLRKPTSSSLRKNLQSPVLQAALMTLTMLDSIALNCGPAVRSTLAERKWMEALLGACAGSDSRAMHIAQLLANWTCAFEGEPLAQASQAVLAALQQRGWQVPVALPEAHHHAEVVQQGFPLRNFHRGCDFLELDAHQRPPAGPQRSSSGASGELPPAGVGTMPQPAAGNSLRRLVRSLSGRRSGPASPTSPAVTIDAQPGSFIEPKEHGSSRQPKELAVDDRLQDMRQVRDELLALERQCLEALDRGSTWQVQHAIGYGDSLAQTLEQFSMDLQAMVFAEAGAARLAEVLDLNDQLGVAVRRWQETLAHLAVAASSAEAKVREGQAEREQVVGHSQLTSEPTAATAPLEWHEQRHVAGLARDAPSALQQQLPSAADWPVLLSAPPAAHIQATSAPDSAAAAATSAQVQQRQQQPQAGHSLSMYPTTAIDFTPAAVPWDAFQSTAAQAQVPDDQGQQQARGVSRSRQAQPQVPAEQAGAALWSRPAQARTPAEHSHQRAGEALQSRAPQPQATADGSKQPPAPLPVRAGQRQQTERQALPEDAFSDLGRDLAESSRAALPSSDTFARSCSPESYSGSEQSPMHVHSRPPVQATGAPSALTSPQPGPSQAASPFAHVGSPSQNEPSLWPQAGPTDLPLAGSTASWQRAPSAGVSSKSLGSLSDDTRSHRPPPATASSARSLGAVAQAVPRAVQSSPAAASSSRSLTAVEQSVPQAVRPSPAAASSTRSLGAVDQSVPLASLVDSSRASSLNPATASRTTSFDSWAVAAPEPGASDQWGIQAAQELSGFEGVSFPAQQEAAAHDVPGPDMGQCSASAADGSPDRHHKELAAQVQQLQHQLRQLQAAQVDAEAAHSAEVKELKRRAVARFKDMAGQLEELQAQCAARTAEAEELRGQVQQRGEEAVELQRRLQRKPPWASADVELAPAELDGRLGQQQEGARPLSAGSTADVKQAASIRTPHATPSRAMDAYWKQPSLRCWKAAQSGDLQVFHSNAHKLEGCSLKDIGLCAASGGHMEVLQWAQERGCDFDACTCAAAAFRGRLAVLQFAHQNDCAWSASTCAGPAAGGHLAVLQFARQHGCPWGSSTCEAAAAGGHLEVLQYSHLNGCPWGPSTCEAAAGGGHLAVLQFARQNGCAWSSSTCEATAAEGHLAVLQFAHQNSCAWSLRTCEAAARGGHLEVLQFAHQNGCAWGFTVCSAAAQRGNLGTLKWLHQHGCPWDLLTIAKAAVNDHYEVLKWALQQQPPCPQSGLTQIHMEPLPQVSPLTLVYLAQQQAPLLPCIRAQAHTCATEMTYAVLSLKAALPDRFPMRLCFI